MITCETVAITTDTNGDGTGYTAPVNGFVRAIRYVKTDYANGVDVTVTAGTSGLAIVTWTNQNASDTSYPQAPANDVSDAALLYAAGGTAVTTLIPVANERIKIVVAEGGSTKAGTFYVYVG